MDKLEQLRSIVKDKDKLTGSATAALYSVDRAMIEFASVTRTLGNNALAEQLERWADAIRRNTGDLYTAYRSLECLIEDKGEGNGEN